MCSAKLTNDEIISTDLVLMQEDVELLGSE